MATQQILYVDYAGGKFEYWYYSEGQRYGGSYYEPSQIRSFYKKNDFTRMVKTDEAKARM